MSTLAGSLMMLSTLLALVYDMVVRAVWQIFSLVFIVSLALCCFVLQRSLLLCVTEIAVALCYRDRCCFVLQRSLLLCVTEIVVALCYRDRCCFVLQRSLLLCVTEIATDGQFLLVWNLFCSLLIGNFPILLFDQLTFIPIVTHQFKDRNLFHIYGTVNCVAKICRKKV